MGQSFPCVAAMCTPSLLPPVLPVLMDFAKSAVPVGADLYQYVQESSHSEPGQQEQPGLAYSQVPVAGRLMKFQKKVEQTQNSTQGLTVAKTSLKKIVQVSFAC